MSPAGGGRHAYTTEINRCDAAGILCVHGQPGGDVVRPWTGTPGCALCRRRHPVHWRTLGEPPAPIPRNVVPIHGSRRLF